VIRHDVERHGPVAGPQAIGDDVAGDPGHEGAQLRGIGGAPVAEGGAGARQRLLRHLVGGLRVAERAQRHDAEAGTKAFEVDQSRLQHPGAGCHAADRATTDH
jgi:hypothetical protein